LNSLFSGYARDKSKWSKGVTWKKDKRKFRAQVNINGRRKHIGYFDKQSDAALSYARVKREYVIKKMENYPDPDIKEAVLKKLS